MSTPAQPLNHPDNSLWIRVQAFLRELVVPHPSIKLQVERSRAQLLAALSLVLALFTLIGGLSSGSYGTFLALTLISLLTYLLSRTKYYYIGTYLFTYSFTSVGFIRIFQGSASSIDSAISATVHISLVLASALLPRGGFVLLVILATFASFAAPLYSNVPPNEVDSVARTGGIVMVLGVILYGVNTFLANLDRARLNELQGTNLELEDARTNLEKRVAERTDELQSVNLQIEVRALRLQAISEISQSIAANSNLSLQELLSFITRSISEKTGYYHAGIFLLDEKREYAVLRAANSAGGRRMLERRHQLKVGGTGIVGYVCQGGRPRIALDTGTDAVFFNNPDLPETRSEMALPLKVGAQVIGALDVQSTSSSAFNDEDVTALSTLANQIAIIIQNSQLMDGSENSQRPSSRLDSQLLQKENTGFSYLPDGSLAAAEVIDLSIVEKTLESGEMVVLDQFTKAAIPVLAVPVKLRDQVIGILYIEAADAKRKWTEDEIAMVQAVSDRAALALENASLFEATERRATQERVVAEVTSRIGESNDVERILQTTIQELGRTLGAARTFVQLGTTSNNGNGAHRDEDGEQS
jgi:GAF domain-containing protein